MLSNGGHSSVVRASDFNCNPWVQSPRGAGWGWETVFLSLRVNSCADLFVLDPPSCVYTAHTQNCVHVKDPICICHKIVTPIAVGMETWKHCTQDGKKEREKLATWGKQPTCFMLCTGTRNLSNLPIKSNCNYVASHTHKWRHTIFLLPKSRLHTGETLSANLSTWKRLAAALFLYCQDDGEKRCG